MTKELDLISILDSIRKANIICNLLANQDQRILIENQPHFMLGEKGKLDKFDYPKLEDSSHDNAKIWSILDEIGSKSEFDINNQINTILISNIIDPEDDGQQNSIMHNYDLRIDPIETPKND